MGTFAVAALIVAILVADRVAPPEEVKRRFYQVGLGVGVVLLVVALAVVIVPVPKDLTGSLALGSPEASEGGLLRERLSIIVGAGLVLLLVGLYLSRMLPTIAVGAMLGGLVLIISAVTDSTSGGFINYYYEITLDGGEARNAAFAAVSGIGVLLLLLYGFNEWDKAPEIEEDEAFASS
jgi:hypothetical protein